MAMLIGIDLGGSKTVVASSVEGGVVVKDELDKSSRPTGLELSVPLRKFGNEMSGDIYSKSIERRKKRFMCDLENPENRKYVFMYIEYLKRSLMKKNCMYEAGTVAIPVFFCMREKSILKRLIDASGLNNINRFVSQLSAAGLYNVVKRKNEVSSNFAVLDFGYQQTGIGIFKYKADKLVCDSKNVIRKGALDFDKEIENCIIEKYKLEDSHITREKLSAGVLKVKKGLAVLPSVSVSMTLDTQESVSLEISMDELIPRIERVKEEIKKFVDESIPKELRSGDIEIVGNGSYFFLMQNILEECGCTYKRSLDPVISVGLGACFDSVINRNITSSFGIKECLGSSVYMAPSSEKEDKSRSKKVCVLNPNSLLGSSVTVRYKRSGKFDIECYEEYGNRCEVIGKIIVNKEKTEEPEVVKVSVCTNSYGLFGVERVYRCVGKDKEEDIEYVYEDFTCKDLNIEEIKELENKYSSEEDRHRKAGEMRNNIENMIDGLSMNLSAHFPELLDEETVNKIGIVVDMLFTNSPNKYEEVVEMRDNAYQELSGLIERLGKIGDGIKRRANSVSERLEPYITPEINKEYMSSNKLTFLKLDTMVKKYLENFSFTIENFHTVDVGLVNDFEKWLEDLIKKHERLTKIKEEKEKEEKLRKEKEAEEKGDANNGNKDAEDGSENTNSDNKDANSDGKKQKQDENTKKDAESTGESDKKEDV